MSAKCQKRTFCPPLTFIEKASRLDVRQALAAMV